MMIQTRLFLTARKNEAEHIYRLIEEEFQEEGFPLAISEVDENGQMFEVSLYVDGDVDRLAMRMKNKINIEVFGLKIKREELPNIDWVLHSLEELKPVRAGRFFVYGSHDRAKCRSHDLAIEIDAGLAFGTGHHDTTTGCLQMIDKVILREQPRNALDLGTGSGILAIAIAKIAPRISILATDIDPIATAVAKENTLKNGVSTRIMIATAIGFYHPWIRNSAPFDLILANILARPLMQFAPEMRRHLAPGGSLILSGILDNQRDKVLAAYRAQGIYHQRTLHCGGWVTLHQK